MPESTNTKPKPAVGSAEWIDEVFSYHAPAEDQPTRYANVREAAKAMAIAIADNCPASTDRTAALRLIREAVMTANASIALNGLV